MRGTSRRARWGAATEGAMARRAPTHAAHAWRSAEEPWSVAAGALATTSAAHASAVAHSPARTASTSFRDTSFAVHSSSALSSRWCATARSPTTSSLSRSSSTFPVYRNLRVRVARSLARQSTAMGTPSFKLSSPLVRKCMQHLYRRAASVAARQSHDVHLTSPFSERRRSSEPCAMNRRSASFAARQIDTRSEREERAELKSDARTHVTHESTH